MFRNLDARLSGEGEGKDLPRSDVSRIVWLGKFRQRQPAIDQPDRSLGYRKLNDPTKI